MAHDAMWAFLAFGMYFLGLLSGVYYVGRPIFRQRKRAPPAVYRSQLPTLVGVSRELVERCRPERRSR